MFRTIIGLLLIASLGVGQELRAPVPLSIRQLEEMEAPKAFQQEPAASAAEAATPKPAKQPKKSRKGLWITVGVVAACTVTALLVADKRLNNEGHGIF